MIEAIENAADAMLIDRLQPEHWEPAPSGAVRNAQPGFLLVAFESARDSVVGFVQVLEIDGVAHLEQLSVVPTYGTCGFTETEPVTDFHRRLASLEKELGLDRYGRRIQMTVQLVAHRELG